MTKWLPGGGVVQAPKPAPKKKARPRALRFRSEKRQAARANELEVTALVFACDGGCRLAVLPDHKCSGPLTPHHLKKASQGGKWTAANIVALCAGANRWVEDYPRRAWQLGLVCRRGERLSDCWSRMSAAGLARGNE